MTLQDEGNWQSLETLIHELKHNSSMFFSVNRPLTVQQPYHPEWGEEGSAEIAGNSASRVAWAAIGGPDSNARLTWDDILASAFTLPDGQGDLRPEFYGVLLRLFRFQAYAASQPNGLFADPQGALPSHTSYARGWTFLRWLGDAYGNAASGPLADADLFSTLNASATLPGVAGIEGYTGKPFRELMEEYAVALMRIGTPIDEGERAFTSYEFAGVIEPWCFAADPPGCDGLEPGPTGFAPWPVTVNSDGTPWRTMQDQATYSGRIGGGGIRIHDFVSNGSGTGAELRFVGVPDDARIVIIKVE